MTWSTIPDKLRNSNIDIEGHMGLGACHLPYGKLLFSPQHARVFWYKIAKGQGFSVTNFLQLQSEKSSDKTRVWFGKFENFDFIPESRGRLSP